MPRSTLPILLAGLAACVAAAEEPSVAWAPTPYTAEQIREATRVGRTYEYLVERPGAAPARRRMVFVAATPERTTTEFTMFDAATGTSLGPPERTDSTYAELRDHARYPKAATTIEATSVVLPAGTFACRRYTVVRAGEGGENRTVACFADALPGPPVQLRRETGGRLTMTMTLLRYEPGQ
jgi:hypothetical protein